MDFEMMGIIMEMVNYVVAKAAHEEMDTPAFTCFVCMLLEEFCKAKGEDVVEVTEMINTAVKQVNETEGRY
jgi:hypothetical protein